MSIRTQTVDNKIWYSAKDVFEQLGITWKGSDSLVGVINTANYTPLGKFKTKVGDRQITLGGFGITEAAIKTLAKLHHKDATVFGFTVSKKSVETTKQVDKLQETVNDLKLVVAKLLTKESNTGKTLQVTGTSGSIRKFDPLQAQARKQVRELVQDYAAKRANELGIVDENRRIFFDLSFKALYNAYKEKTQNKLDLKALAEEEATKTGVKTSGLQIAERLGVALELLRFAKSFYKL